MTEKKTAENSPDPLKVKILTALRRGGYALEMQVAIKARSAFATTVIQSGYYIDQSTSKVREIDVAAMWADFSGTRERTVALWLAIECKSKPAPWVVFDQHGLGGEYDIEFIFSRIPQISSPAGRTDFYRRGTAPGQSLALFDPARYGFGTGIVEMPFNQDLEPEDSEPESSAQSGAKRGQINGAWAAVQGAIAAANGLRAEWREKFDFESIEESSDSLLTMWVPVVVTSGKLYTCKLDEQGAMELEEVRRASITAGAGPQLDNIRCLVVTEPEVDSLLADAASTFETLKRNGD